MKNLIKKTQTPRLRISKQSKSSHKSSSKMDSSISMSISENDELDLEDVWVESLTSLSPEITSAVLNYILRPSLDEQEKTRNTMVLLSFYNACNKIPELIDFCVERDYYWKLDNVSKYSPYSTILSSVINVSYQNFFIEIHQQLMKRGAKMKGIILDEEKKSSSDKELKKVKEFLANFMEIWMDYKDIMCIWSKTQDFLISKGVDQSKIDMVMIQLCFLLPFNCFASLFTTDIESTEIILFFSKLMNSLLSTVETHSYWKNWIKTNSKDLTEKIVNYIRNKKGMEIERDKITISSTYEPTAVIYMLNNDWRQLKDYLSPEGYKMIEIHMTEETNLKKRALLIIRELNNLRVSTFNENQMYLQKMSEMKMRMKDLQEERRYLRQILYPEESETISIEEDKDLSTHS
ncbi:hypothetical protein CL6EHI_079280 [Entamoeba histolytica]|uniref:Uncharacterized protein n=1 Tax=Entamoeba histolytica TaxID=5759 RepID=A0A175JV29_ENTHI|nr:hypothetical protein CL6EHI_079280 [Entamoeba histolytica]